MNFIKFILLLGIITIIYAHNASNSSQSIPAVAFNLTDASFDSLVQQGKHASWFVLFYVPWCPHCKRLKKIWNQLAAEFTEKVNIGMLDW